MNEENDIDTTQFFIGQMPFLLPHQQRQSTEGIGLTLIKNYTLIFTTATATAVVSSKKHHH